MQAFQRPGIEEIMVQLINGRRDGGYLVVDFGRSVVSECGVEYDSGLSMPSIVFFQQPDGFLVRRAVRRFAKSIKRPAGAAVR